MIKIRISKAAVFVWLIGGIGFTNLAHAVNINPGGYGQVLIYPYYTANDGNVTLLSIANNSENAKAVKIRLVEGKIGLPALYFNLYLAAKDVWSASVQSDNGTVTLKTNDTSCTVPYVYRDGGIPVDGGIQAEYFPNPYAGLFPMSEGHIEVIEMGTVREDTDSEGYVTQVDGEPVDCDAILRAWAWPDTSDPNTRGYWLMNPSAHMGNPSGGLFGGAAIVNPRRGTLYSYDAIAINGFADSIDANDFLHTEPGFTTPNLNSGDITTGYVFLDNGGNSNWTFNRGVDAVSYVLMQDSLANHYTAIDSVGASTEWVLTFPTKSFYVYPNFSNSGQVIPPFTSLWSGSDACEPAVLEATWGGKLPWWKNFAKGKGSNNRADPPPSPDVADSASIELCYSTNVIAFGEDGGDVLASNNLITVDEAGFFTPGNGWARLELDDYSWDANGDEFVDCDEDGVGSECFSRSSLGNLNGLPVAGFSIQRFAIGFGGVFQHKTTRKLGQK